MTILDACVQALRQSDKPMSAKEILQAIQDKNLYTFGAKDPLKVLSGTISKEVRRGDSARVTEVDKRRFRLAR